ncbi:DoxX family protein [Ottowia sp.]|jgi:putative oxidoreductase|uniref:DoxX family protein n=1 Tax=Ottowia sp. TaxID=1898956 RepID=UPI002B99CB46|nr:DoxX family protein [Ottowia sp.]HRN75606.1 DoxX family protein [Ottowia sp.]HRQ01597.1 DoxX family protein [Ottowia sp.]
MNALQNPLALIGRLLLAYIFIPAGFSKLGAGFGGTVGYIASKGLPMPEVLAALAIVVEIGAGIALLIGYKTRWAALALALFTAAAALFFHNYWAVPAEQQMVQQLMFGKNLGMVGGLLAFAALGAGALSLDARRRA